MRLVIRLVNGRTTETRVLWYRIHEFGLLEFMDSDADWHAIAPESWIDCTVEHWGQAFTFTSPARVLGE